MLPHSSQLSAESTSLIIKGGFKPCPDFQPVPIIGEPPCWPSPGDFGKAGDCFWGTHNASTQPYHVVASKPDPSAELHNAGGPDCPPLMLPRNPVLVATSFLRAGKAGGSPLSTGYLSAPIRGAAGCPQSGCASASDKLTRDQVRGKIAQTSWLPLSATGLQLDICRAVSPVPSGDCLILLSVSLQKSLSVGFFYLTDLSFFFPVVASGLLPGDRRAIPV